MRAGVLVVGILLAILGGILAFVPFIPTGSQTITAQQEWAFNVTAAFSITGTVPLSISWSSPTDVTVQLVTCDSVSDLTCTNEHDSEQNGTSGTFAVNPKVNGAVGLILGTPGNATVTVREAQPTIGDALLIVGGLFVVAGIVLPRRKPPAPVPVPAPT